MPLAEAAIDVIIQVGPPVASSLVFCECLFSSARLPSEDLQTFSIVRSREQER